ncbi:MAG: hypothetical protein RL139_1158 [Gemmatimonadota bacterium]|jgi:Bacterial Ig-like domain (group 2)/Leishmanolysin
MPRPFLRLTALGLLLGLGLHACASPTEPLEPTTLTPSTATVTLDAIGATQQLSVTVLDQKGTAMTGLVPTWTVSDPTVVTIAASGLVTALRNGTATLTATVGAATTTVAVTVAQVPAAPVAVAGNGQTGQVRTALANPLVARVVDRLGAPIAGVDVTFAIISGGGSLSVTTSRSVANGEASTVWTLGSSALVAPRVTATVAGQSTIFTATATGGPPAQMIMAPGVAADGQRAKFGTAVEIAPAVQILDALGNPVAGQTVTFSVLTGGGSVTGASAVTSASGVATVGSWTLGPAVGTNTLQAAFGALTPVVFTATAVLDPCTAAGATPFIVPDTVAGSISNADCSWTPPPNSSENTKFDLYKVDLTSPTALIIEMTKVSGIEDPYLYLYNATTGDSLAANDDIQSGVLRDSRIAITLPAGSYLVRATTWGPAERGTYNLAIRGCRVGDPTTYRIKAGNGQMADPGTAVATAPSVEVLDECGNGMPGVTVTFATVAGVGSLTGASATTNASGVATVGSWTLAAGPNVLSATLPASPSVAPVIFSANGKAGGGASTFDISLRFVNMPTANQLATFGQAAARWESIITGDLPGGPINVAAGSCNSPVAINETLDDVIIVVRLENIDGVGQVLGSAGPCFVRSAAAGGLTSMGSMRFDTSDLPTLETAGTFNAVILHEMGHVLGIGTLWGSKGFLQLPSTTSAKQDTHFNGPEAITGFNAIGGSSYTGASQTVVPGGAKVPVENCAQGVPSSCGSGTINSHWRENVLQTELMTGYLNGAGSNPLSALTIGSLKDLGYVVDASKADAFFQIMSLEAGLMASEPAGPLIPFGDDIHHGPILELGRDGRPVGEVTAPVPVKRRRGQR